MRVVVDMRVRGGGCRVPSSMVEFVYNLIFAHSHALLFRMQWQINDGGFNLPW